MKNPKFDRANVARWLQNLSDNQFIEFFSEHLAERHIYRAERHIYRAERHIYRAERRYVHSHLVLAAAVSSVDEPEWRLQILNPPAEKNWSADARVCQFGTHCGHETASVSKTSICAICGKGATGS